jgi:hypothetical protein
MALEPGRRHSAAPKINAQWRELAGLHTRAEWSEAVVRAVTATKIAWKGRK